VAHFAPFKNAFSKEQITPCHQLLLYGAVAEWLGRGLQAKSLTPVRFCSVPPFLDNKKDYLRE